MNGKLIIRLGDREKVHEICEDLVRIGSEADSDLVIKSGGCAPHHCEIRRTSRGFKLIDLETAAGTTVNGEPVNQHMLRDADVIGVGEVTLVYEGDSATPAAKPKRPPRLAPPPVATSPDGEPRRFYKHESKNLARRSSNPAALAFVLLLVMGVVIIVVVAGKSSYQASSDLALDEIKKLRDRGDVASLKQAQEKLDAIPRTDLESEHRATIAALLKRDLAKLEQIERQKAETRRYNDVIRAYRAGGNLKYLEKQIQEFRNEFPGSIHIAELEQFHQKAAFGTPENEARYRRLYDDATRAINAKAFKQAFAHVKALEDDPALSKAFAENIAVLRQAADRAFDGYYQSAVAEARQFHAEGQTEKARELFRHLVEVGQEPYATQAKTQLARLQ